MRMFAFHEPWWVDGETVDVEVRVSEDELVATFWPWWVAKMLEVGKPEAVSWPECLTDWIVTNWAQEVTDDD